MLSLFHQSIVAINIRNNAGDISISDFRGHIGISGCRPLLKSLADSFFEHSVVLNPRLAVGILMISLIVSEI